MRIKIVLLLCSIPLTSLAGDNEQMWQEIEQLKQRVERLEAEAGIVGVEKETAAEKQSQPVKSGKVFTRYWLSKNAAFDSSTEAPMREGMMSLGEVIKLAPEVYGYKSSVFFDKHDDSSLFPVAAVMIEGELEIRQSGLYQLTVKPTPPREVGGAGNVEVSLEVATGDEQLFTMPFSKKLASQQKEVRLKAGRQPLSIKILARSPGFGPSPTRTHVYIGLQAEGEIASTPINSYLTSQY